MDIEIKIFLARGSGIRYPGSGIRDPVSTPTQFHTRDDAPTLQQHPHNFAC
jgi:hypothetical protein